MVDCIISKRDNYKNNTCFMFIKDKFLQWNLETKMPVLKMYERQTHPYFNALPDKFLNQIDAGFNYKNFAYLFSKNKWLFWDLDKDEGSDMFDLFDNGNFQFRQLPLTSIDCCISRTETEIYFFKDNIVILYDIDRYKIIFGPVKFKEHPLFKNLPFDKIDSAVHLYQKDCYIFSGNKWIRWNLELGTIIYGPYKIGEKDFRLLNINQEIDINECSQDNVNMLMDNCRYLKSPDTCREVLKCDFLKDLGLAKRDSTALGLAKQYSTTLGPARDECRKLRIPVSMCQDHIINRTKRRCGQATRAGDSGQAIQTENSNRGLKTSDDKNQDFHVKDVPCRFEEINKWHEFCTDFKLQNKCDQKNRDLILNKCKSQISGILEEVYDDDVPLPQKICDPKVLLYKEKEEIYIDEGGPAYATNDKKEVLKNYPEFKKPVVFSDANTFDRRIFAPEDRPAYNDKFKDVVEKMNAPHSTNLHMYIVFLIFIFFIYKLYI